MSFPLALVMAAQEELNWWNSKGCTEAQSPCAGRVGQYWKNLGIIMDGTNPTPWSAAFICHCMRQAGMPDMEFPYSAAHAAYIRWAIVNQTQGKPHKTYYGRRINEYAPKPGDLIATWRQKKVTYGSIPNGHFSSHCDIVVDLTATHAIAIGGNVSDRVKTVRYPLASSGKLQASNKLIAVLECRKP